MLVDIRQPFLDSPVECLGELRGKGYVMAKLHVYPDGQACRLGEFADKAPKRRLDGQLFERCSAHRRHRAADVLQALQRQSPGSTDVFEGRLSALRSQLLSSFELDIGDRQIVRQTVVNFAREPVTLLGD